MSCFFGHISSKKNPTKEQVFSKDNLEWKTLVRDIGTKEITMSFLDYPQIEDKSPSFQPYTKCLDDNLLLFNGRIYNALDLKSELLSAGNNIQTNTDEEILYLALLNWGIENTLNKLNGAFVFAFCDFKESNIIIARDHVGLKSIYFTNTEESFSFATDLSFLFSQNIIKPSLNKQRLGEFFAQGWICEPDTLFKDIYKLEAGAYLSFNFDKKIRITKKKYWNVFNDSENIDCPDIKSIIERKT